jgi:hypothetical protein
MNRFRQFASHAAIAAAVTLAASPMTHAADNCGAQPRCYDAGPFAAEVTSLGASWNNVHNQHFLRLNLRFRNTGSAPLILGFAWGSAATLTDNYGNAYTIDGNNRANVIGIGLTSREGADTSFVVAPGASRSASFVFNRGIGRGSSGSAAAVGSTFTADFSVEQLQVLPGSQRVQIGGQYSLDFPGLSSGLMGAGSADELGEGIGSLINAFTKKR